MYGIGLIHEARSEFNDALNVLQQALSINESNQNDHDDDLNAFTLAILHRIGITYQSMEDTNKATDIFENIKNIIQSKGTSSADEENLCIMFGFDANETFVQAAAAA